MDYKEWISGTKIVCDSCGWIGITEKTAIEIGKHSKEAAGFGHNDWYCPLCGKEDVKRE